ncbi:MAG TPA: hypothetical protein VFQ53_21790 [Kofleriaceae bacterium]|nr:hypothetical protein [Kofleriaceae bacterium]
MRAAGCGWFAAISVIAACSHTLPTTDPVLPPARSPAPARASFEVVPAELADPGVLGRIRHRARIKRFGAAWLGTSSEALSTSRDEGDAIDELGDVVPVLGESTGKIRIVVEDDDARLAIWVARGDLWESIAAAIPLADRDGHASPSAGVWLSLGAPVVAAPARDHQRFVKLHDPAVLVEGYAAASSIAHVWVVPPGAPIERSGALPPSDPRPRQLLASHARIRAAAAPDAPVLATIENDELFAAVLGTRGAYREIELVRPFARIRGFVLATELSPSDDETLSLGGGGRHGFGMSHADHIDVPAGTCLFESAEGEVVGVQLKPTIRLGHLKSETAGWSRIYIATAWSVVTVYIHDTSRDPAQPAWESCAEPAHR